MISGGARGGGAEEVAHIRVYAILPQPSVMNVPAAKIFRQTEHALRVILHVLGAPEETPDAYWHGLIRCRGAKPKILVLSRLPQIGLREERPTLGVEASYQFGVLEDPGIVLHWSKPAT